MNVSLLLVLMRHYVFLVGVVIISSAVSYRAFAQFSNGQAASIVIGQPNFTSNSAAAGANGMNWGEGIAVDAVNNKMYVVDRANHRVLRFAFPITTIQPNCEVVFGQTNTTNNLPNAGGSVGAVGMNNPTGVAVNQSNGDLFVVENGNHRILRFSAAHTVLNGSHGPSAASVIGQPNFTTAVPGTSQNTLNFPHAVIITPGFNNMWIVDQGNHRVLRIPNASIATTQPNYDYCIGQTAWTNNTTGNGANQLNSPAGVCVNAAATLLFIADGGNNRVLRFTTPPATTFNASAAAVLGQTGFNLSASGNGAAQMNTVRDVAMDASGTLYVSDLGNNRVLGFANATSLANGASASFVLGQAGFGTSSSGLSSTQMNGPRGLAVNGSRLFVSEQTNNRVLQFSSSNAPWLYMGTLASSNVMRTRTDGMDLVTNLLVTTNPPRGAQGELSSGYIVWPNPASNSIGRANLDGTGVNNSFITGLSNPYSPILAGGYIYWLNRGTNSIGRALWNGTGVNTTFITGCSTPENMVVDAVNGYIYWTNYSSNTIGRANIDGTGVNQSLATTLAGPTALDVDPVNNKIYWGHWTGGGTIQWANTDGTGVGTWYTVPGSVLGLAVDQPNGKVYWHEYSAARIGSANLNASAPNNSLITGLPSAVGMNLLKNSPAPPAPTVTSFLPTNAGPGQTVTITGTGFSGISQVQFGGTNAASFTVVSATQITAVVNAGASGSVSVTNVSGTGSQVGFTYNAPTVTTLYAARTGGQIGTVRTDGTLQNLAAATGIGFGRDVFRLGSYIYWCDETANRIGRANADGSSPNVNFITGCSAPNGLYVTATNIYWTNYGSTTLGRANIDGTGVNQAFCNTGLTQPVGIAVDVVGGFIYWSRTNFNSIGRVALDGVTGLNGSFMTGLVSPGGIWIDNPNNFLYFTQSGASNTIQRAQLSTGTGVTTLVTGCSTPTGITSDGTFLFWSNQGTGNIGRSLMSGAGALQTFSTGFTGLRGIGIGPNPLPGPTITTVLPASAQAGATITITGTNFTGASTVFIGNQSVPFTLVLAMQITFTVPNVCSSGLVSVLTPNGSATSAAGFTYLATYVLGQTNFTTATPGTLNNKFNSPNGMAIDAANNKLYVAEFANHRVLRFSLPITQNSQLPEAVFGQVNFTSGLANGGGTTNAAVFNGPFTMNVGTGGDLWITDILNNRLVMIPSAHTATNGASATLVIGQPNLTSNAAGLSAQNVSAPYSARLDASGNMWVADNVNRRVLQFTAPLSTFQSASVALGVPDFVTNNVVLPTSTRTGNTGDIAIVGTSIYVSDIANHRILRYNAPYITGMAASVVLGQPSMTTGLANNPNSTLGLNFVQDLYTNGTDLFVADVANHRVLVYLNVNSKTSGAAPDAVIGQPNLTTLTSGLTQSKLNGLRDVAITGAGQLIIADQGNNRVLVFGPTFATPAPTISSFTPTSALAGATVTIRGTNFTGTTQVQFGGVNAASFTVISATEISAVVAVGGASGNVSVTTPAGTANLAGFTFLAPPTVSGFVPATGQAGTSITVNGANFTGATSVQIGNQSVGFSVISATQISIPSVPILGGGGLISVTTPVGTGVSATGFGFNGAFVIGQPNFTSSAAATTSTGLNFPEGIAVDVARGKIYVADRLNNRVLRYAYPVTANNPVAQIVFGQPNLTSGVANNGGLSASSLNTPADIFVDQSNGDLWVSDYINNRVLRFAAAHAIAANQPAATQVLGQPNFTSNGFATTQSGMNQPHGLALEAGGRLWVADYANNRILRFDNAASLGNGANANAVLGQPNFTSNAPSVSQAGGNAPLSLAIDAAGNLFSADVNANRVLRYNNAASKPNGANADGVLGQTLFTTNAAGVTATAMNYPGGLAISPAGDLFVSDRNNNRILGFNNAVGKANGAAADRVLGQTTFTTSIAATTQSGMNLGQFLTYVPGDNVLLSSEWNNNRVVIYGTPTPPPPPAITGFLPTASLAGGTVVITGTNLNNASVVQFGGTNAASFVVNSPTQITAVVGAGAMGNVTVTTPGGTANQAGFTFYVPPTAFSAAAPPTGTVGSAYTYTFVANGVPTPTYAVQSGTLPPGLTLSAAGVLSGTPTGAGGTFGPIVIRATNVGGFFDCAPFNITINAAPTAFSAQTPPIGAPNVAYAPYTFVADGFPTPTYAVQTGGALPTGLVLSGAGILSGTPTVGGVFGPYTVRASNVAGTFDTAPFTITLGTVPTAYSAQTPPSGAVGLSYSYIFTANGLPAPTYSVQSGTLPTGLSLNTATGELSGTPSATGTFGPITIRATNVMGAFDTAPFNITINTAPSAFSAQTPPSGTVGAVYSYSYSANGLPAPTYSLFVGTLPPGVFLNSATGQLFGTPTVGGVYSGIVIRASNIAGAFNSAPATITISGAPTAFTAAPVNGVVGSPYTYTFTANGFPTPTYSVFSGVLPPGLSLNGTTGELSGTPTMAGVFGVTIIRANNGAGSLNSNSFSITIAGTTSSPTSFSAASPSIGTSGTPYSYTFAANGFPSPTFSIASGALPPGLTLNPVTGELSGTPTASGSFGPITVNASNGSGTLTSSAFTIQINGAPTAFSAQTPGAGVVGTPYSYTLVANGLPSPSYTILSGSLPPGLTMSALGVISGTPGFAGTFGPIVVQASNSAGSVNCAPFSITVTATGSAPTLFTAQSPPNGIVSNSYAYTFAANGSPAPTLSIVSGTLPPGLALTGANGLLSGVPTAFGVFGPIILSATNGFGSINSAPFNITVNAAPTVFTAQSPTNGAVGSAYLYSFSANGFPAPTFSLVGGTLPPGLTLSPSGVLSGNPTTFGVYSGIVIQAQNAFGNVNSIPVSITVAATAIAPTSFTAQTPPSGNLTSPYSYTIAANGSPSPTYSVVAGTLPTGLTLNAVTGVISGIPTAAGGFGPITVQASNSAGMINTVPFFININQAPPTITSFTPTGAAAGATITINGTNLTGVSAVSFGGVAATSFMPVSATQVTAVVAAGGATGNVNVTTPGGTATLGVFSFFAPPTITSFSPMIASPGSTVTIVGTNFTGATQVQFGGLNAASFTVVSPTQITAVVPLGAPNMPISVTTPAGTGNSVASFMLVASSSQFYYQSGPADNPANWNTLPNGGGLTATSFATAGQSFIVTNARTAVLSASATVGAGVTMQVENTATLVIANGQTLDIQGSLRVNNGGRLQLNGSSTVTGVAGVQYLGSQAILEYRGANNRLTSDKEFPPSFIASLKVDSGSVLLNNSKAIQGALTLLNGSVVNFGANNGLVLQGDIALGNGKLGTDISNALEISGTGTITGSASFDALGTNSIGSLKMQRVGANLAIPATLSIERSLLLMSGVITVGNGQTLQIHSIADTALQGGSASSFVIGALARRIPANLTPMDARIWSYPIGKGVHFLPAVVFSITSGTVSPLVAMEAFNTASGGSSGIGLTGALSKTEYWGMTTLAGNFTGTQIGLIRQGVNDSTRVAIGTTQSGVYRSIGGSLISVPLGQAIASSGFSVSSSSLFFTVAGAAPAPGDTTPTLTPKITRFSPDRGGAETVVTVIGENLTGINSVAIGTIPVANFRVLSSTGLSITVGDVRTGPIQIGGPNGGTASNGVFTFVAAPVIMSVSPQTAGPGATVTITGQNLQNVTTLTFGGVTITNFTLNPDGSITFVVPQGATSGSTNTQIRLNAEGGMAQATTSVVVIPQPIIRSFVPATESTGAIITINGENFIGVQSVRFGTDAASASANFTRNDSARITVTVPARVVGMGTEVPIILVMSGGIRVTSATLFAYKASNSGSNGFTDLSQRIEVTEFVDKIAANGGEVRVRGVNLNVITDISLRTKVSTGKAEYRASSSGQITLLLPKQNLLSGTGGTVSSSATTVVFLGPYNAVVAENAFSIISSPEVRSVEPSSANVGEEIVVTGTSLDLVTALSIGGTNATFRLEGTTRLIITMPARSANSMLPLAGNLVLTSVGGLRITTGLVINANLAGGLPTITSFAPPSGRGGTVITVTGANLSIVNMVRVGESAISTFRLLSPNALEITLPSGVNRKANGVIRLVAASGEAVSREPFRFTESLEADSARVAELLRQIPNGQSLLNWSGDVDITEWKGVEVLGNRIITVRVNNVGLRGSLPSGLSALTQLRVLDISGNNFTGIIPPSFAGLTLLEEFHASRNQLSGSLSGDILCAWKRLRRFDVSGNAFTGEIPSCLHQNDNIEVLNFGNNRLTGQIPWQLGAMQSLRELRLNNNQLTGALPREFGSIGNRTALTQQTGKNGATLTQAQTLQILDISNNQLEGRIPAEWVNMVNMREFNLSNNLLFGEVPRGIGSWKSLVSLRLANNSFFGELPSGVQWENLVEIRLENNRFTGAVPLEIAQSSRLRSLRVQNNRFTALPNLSRTRVDTVMVENNAIEFGSLEPLLRVSPAIRLLNFTPQQRIGVERDTVVERGASLVLPSGIGGEQTTYQWFKDSSIIRGAAGRQPVFRLDSAIRVNSGVYFCRATNPQFPSLTLETATIRVSVASVDALLATPEAISPASGAINVSPNLTLRWTRIEGATDYEVQWWKLENNVAVNMRTDTLGQPDSGEPQYVLRGLERGAEFQWRTRALIRSDRGAVLESGNAMRPSYFKVVVPGVDLAFSTVDAGKTTIADNRDVPGGVLINVSGAPLTILRDGITVISRDSSFRIKTEQVAGIVKDTTLLPNGELALGIEFTPSEAEPIVASLQVRYRDNGGTNRTITFNDALRGRGSALAIRPVDFDTVRVGRGTLQSVEVFNRSKIHTMQIQAVQLLAVRGAPSENSFRLVDATDLQIAPSTSAFITVRCFPTQEGVRRAGVRVVAVSTKDTSVTDVSFTSITAFARLPKPDDAAVSLKVRAVPDSAVPGAIVRLNVVIEDATSEKLRSVFQAAQPIIEGRVQFSKQVLSLASASGGARLIPDPTGNDKASVVFNTSWEGRNAAIATLEARAVAGSKVSTVLNLASLVWGTSASARLPWERKVFVEESPDTTLFTYTNRVSQAGGKRLISSTSQTVSISAIVPNPVKDLFEVSYSLPESDFVTITLVDARGNEVMMLLNEVVTAGKHTSSFKVNWLSSGSYLVKMVSSRGIATSRMEIIR